MNMYTGRHDITEIRLKTALNTMQSVNQPKPKSSGINLVSCKNISIQLSPLDRRAVFIVGIIRQS